MDFIAISITTSISTSITTTTSTTTTTRWRCSGCSGAGDQTLVSSCSCARKDFGYRKKQIQSNMLCSFQVDTGDCQVEPSDLECRKYALESILKLNKGNEA